MTTDREAQPRRRFASEVLPWLVAAVALALYLGTLSHWLTADSLYPTARVAGWGWQPTLSNPLLWVATLPFQLLPDRWIPLTLNLYAAMCAAFTLALLARSVALLPQDRTHLQRLRERSHSRLLSIPESWLPPLLAVAGCGLQLTFWENATAGTGEMLDVLLFAYVVRCFLEYRLDPRDSWMVRATFVYALGMTNDWLLIGLLPFFLTAVIWIMGLGFLNSRFLSRLLLAGVAGLSLFLLLPLVGVFHPTLPVPFWPALKSMLADQKSMLLAHHLNARGPLAMVGLVSLLPLLVMAIRFRAYFGDDSPLGIWLATTVAHVLHGIFLVFCTWVLLDPPFSPAQLGLGPRFLPACYLAALAVGYFSGYFLLLFRDCWEEAHRLPLGRRLRHGIVTVAVWSLLLVVPAVALYRNLPQVRATNGTFLKQYATLLAEALPKKDALVLCDDPRRFLLLQAVLAEQPSAPAHVLADTRSLKFPAYHQRLSRSSGAAWPPPPTNAPPEFDEVVLIDLLKEQSEQRPIYYLHPSFGYYFELFQQTPHGLVYELTRYPTNSLFSTPLARCSIERNQEFWGQQESRVLAPLIRLIGKPIPGAAKGWAEPLLARARLEWTPNREALIAGRFYSRALNHWAVELQRLGRLTEAAAHFDRALQLNPDNKVARVNREFNRSLAAGSKAAVRVTPSIEDHFGKYRTWDHVVGENGPYDEPTFCYEQGRVFAQQGLHRQAIRQFERVRELVPDDLASRRWLLSLYLNVRHYDRALDVVQELRSRPLAFGLSLTNEAELLWSEASARFGSGDAAAGVQLLETVRTGQATNSLMLSVAADVYMLQGLLTNALQVIHDQLRLNPADAVALRNKGSLYLQMRAFPEALQAINDLLRVNPADAVALGNKGFACLQMGAFRDAIPPLTQLLKLQTTNALARFNRALAYLQSDDLEAAQGDYEDLHRQFPKACQVHYGLAEIASRKQNTNDAVRFFQLYLSNAPPDSAEAKLVRERLQQMQPPAS